MFKVKITFKDGSRLVRDIEDKRILGKFIKWGNTSGFRKSEFTVDNRDGSTSTYLSLTVNSVEVI